MNSKERINNVLNILKTSIRQFYNMDINLITNDYVNYRKGMEQACAFRIGLYFCNKMKHSIFYSYDIDMEYNKHNFEQKCIDDSEHGKRPDLIVHKRWSDNDNFLIVEFKDTLKRNIIDDEEKLKYFTNKTGKYKYKIGIIVVLNNSWEDVEYRYFQNGKRIWWKT